MEDGEYRRRRDGDSDDEHEGKGSGNKGNDKKKKNDAAAGVDLEKPIEELSPEEQEARMMAMMGFGGFESTKVRKRHPSAHSLHPPPPLLPPMSYLLFLTLLF